MRTAQNKLNPILENQIKKTLIQIVVDIKSPDEATSFLSDFFTKVELESFAKRLAVSYWLSKKRSYTNIKENLKVSSATIAFVAQKMKLKGFQLALKKIEADEWASKWTEKIKKIVGKSL